jgi:hypothetical protein
LLFNGAAWFSYLAADADPLGAKAANFHDTYSSLKAAREVLRTRQDSLEAELNAAWLRVQNASPMVGAFISCL